MSVVHIIDTLAEWAQANICDKIRLKAPPPDDEASDERYDYDLVNPAAFPMYVPTEEKLPPNIHTSTPSLCVRFVKGADDLSGNEGSLEMQFCFSAWDPGTHGQDVFHPTGAWSFNRQNDTTPEFTRTGDGWRDVWNFVDIARRALESTTRIGDVIIDRSTPIQFGPLTEQEAIPDFYPFWFAWISFRVTYPLRRNIPELENLL